MKMFIFLLIFFFFDYEFFKRIWTILSELLLGLATLKGLNMIHGNIRGENVFITEDKSIKLGLSSSSYY
jgi:serine/threonine protein kinase